MCGSLNEVKSPWCGEIMFDKRCYFLFWRGSVDEEHKMDHLIAMSIECLGGLYEVIGGLTAMGAKGLDGLLFE